MAEFPGLRLRHSVFGRVVVVTGASDEVDLGLERVGVHALLGKLSLSKASALSTTKRTSVPSTLVTERVSLLLRSSRLTKTAAEEGVRALPVPARSGNQGELRPPTD
jgi:hypothetical protein